MTPVLNDASAVYLGSQQADRVYVGGQKVWPKVPPGTVYGEAVLADTPLVFLRFKEAGLTAVNSGSRGAGAWGTLSADKRTTDSPTDAAACGFDGTNSVTLSGDLWPSNFDWPLSVEFWWKYTEPAPAQGYRLFDWAPSNTRGLQIAQGSDQKLYVGYAAPLYSAVNFSSPGGLTLGAWTHVVMTYDESAAHPSDPNTWRLYINGAQAASLERASNLDAPTEQHQRRRARAKPAGVRCVGGVGQGRDGRVRDLRQGALS